MTFKKQITHLSLNTVLSLTSNILTAAAVFLLVVSLSITSSKIESTVQKANKNILVIDYILNNLYDSIGSDVRRVSLVIFSNNDKTKKPLLTVIHDVFPDNYYTITDRYVNVPMSDKAYYYKELLKGHCVRISVDQFSIVTEELREEKVGAIAVPINTPYLIGEVTISFDRNYPMKYKKELYCKKLREASIDLGKLLR